MEENVRTGGMGEAVCEYLRSIGAGLAVLQIAAADEFVPHGNVEELKRRLGLDAQSIAKKVMEAFKERM